MEKYERPDLELVQLEDIIVVSGESTCGTDCTGICIEK